MAAHEVAVVPGAHFPWTPALVQALGTALNRCAASAHGTGLRPLLPAFSAASSEAGTLRVRMNEGMNE